MQPVRRTSLISQVTEQLRDEITSGRWPVGPQDPHRTGTVRAHRHRAKYRARSRPGTRARGHARTPPRLGNLCDRHLGARRHSRQVLRRRARTRHPRAAPSTRHHRRRPGRAPPRRHRHRQSAPLARRTQQPELGRSDPVAIAADVELHRAIVVASHNAVYLEFYDSLLPIIEQVIHARTAKSDDAYDTEHEELVQAVIDGDAERAVQAANCFLGSLIAEYPDR